MIRALVSGILYGDPVVRTSQAGKSYESRESGHKMRQRPFQRDLMMRLTGNRA